MRLTLINQFYTPDISPTAHLCASLAEHRAARGDHVTVLTSRTGYLGTLGANTPAGTVNVRRLWSTRFGSRGTAGRLLDWITFYIPAFWAAAILPRQDVVIAMTTPPFIALAGWIHKLLHPRSALILWNMDVYPEAIERTGMVKPDSIVSRLMRSAHRAIFKRLNHLVCLDNAMATLLLSQYMPANRRVAHTIIPNWERQDLFSIETPTVPMDHPVSNIPLDHRVVLYLGNAGYGHEFQTLIEAAEQLRDDPVTVLFVGGGALRPWLGRQIAARGLSNILLRGYVPKEQTPAVMRRADFALITLEDSMLGVMSPSKLHANLAMGLPVIYVGPKESNVDAAIVRFGCGVSLRQGDSEGFATFVRWMMADSQAHSRLRQNARIAFDEAYRDGTTLLQFDQVIDQTREIARARKG